MQVKLYMDIIFLINFIVDFLVLFSVNVMLRLHTKWWRIILGGLAGAFPLLFFVPCMFLVSPMEGTLIYIGISIEANLICFGYKNGFFQKWLLSTTIMVLIGNGMNYIKYIFGFTVFDFSKWILCFFTAEFCVFIVILKLIKYQKNSKHIYTVKFTQNNHAFFESLYLDTGNFLWDPLFQKPVIVLSEGSISACFTVEEYRLLKKYLDMGIFNYKSLHSSEMQKKYCFHEICYESVGRKKGKMLCFLMDEVEIAGAKKKLYKQPVAIASKTLFEGKQYQGLLQPDCISL